MGEARRRAADEAPGDAEQQQGEDGVTGPEVELHPVAAGAAGEVRRDQQDDERPVEQAHRHVPDAHFLVELLGHPMFSFAGGPHAVVMGVGRRPCSLCPKRLQQIPCRRAKTCRRSRGFQRGWIHEEDSGCGDRRRTGRRRDGGRRHHRSCTGRCDQGAPGEPQADRLPRCAPSRASSMPRDPRPPAVEQAAKLKTLEAAFVKMFPAGSDKGETKALPTVWSDMAGLPGGQQGRRCRLRQARRRGGLGRPGSAGRRLRRYRQGLRRLPRQVPRQGELIAGAIPKKRRRPSGRRLFLCPK